MIKILKNKFLICLFLLVTIFSVTSSCFAATFSNEILEAPFILEDLYASEDFQTRFLGVDLKNINVFSYYAGSWKVKVFANSNVSYYKVGKTSASVTDKSYSLWAYDSNDTIITNLTVYTYNYSADTGFEYSSASSGSDHVLTYGYSSSTITNFGNVLTSNLYDSSGNLWCEAQEVISTAFTYKFEGVKRGQCKLIIEGLDSSLKMLGYVDLENTLSVGDTLDYSLYANKLRLLATKTDNSDLYCYLYEKEEITYYIVDENYKILDIGTISDMAKGYFLYGFTVNDGVDFVFLKDGQVYWSNGLTFKYSVYDVESIDNNIVSAGTSSYIKSDSTTSSSEYIGKVYDNNNNLIATANAFSSNDLSSFSIKVDTAYEEDNDAYDEAIWKINFIHLEGTNKDGSLIDFSNYYIRWSVPTDFEIVHIKVNNSNCDKRNGVFSSPTSFGRFTCFWELRDYVSKFKDEYVAFDITLEVYDGNDNKVLTHVINSNDITSKQIESEENNVDKNDYVIVDNPRL